MKRTLETKFITHPLALKLSGKRGCRNIHGLSTKNVFIFSCNRNITIPTTPNQKTLGVLN